MIRIWATIAVIVSTFYIATANNVRIKGEAKVQALTENTALITFPLSWEHSWRESESWDAVYLFVKYRRVGVNEPWHHAYLKDSGHRVAGGGNVPAMEFLPVKTVGTSFLSFDTIYTGNYYPTPEGIKPAVPGVFLFRKTPGNGNLDISRVSLEWNFTQGDLSLYYNVTVDDIRNKKIEVSVQAVEMVYVPNGPYYLGDRISHYSYVSQDCGSALFVNTDEEMRAFIMGLDGSAGVKNNWVVPKLYPTGYTGFYTMKYELSQEQYVNFLNRTTYQDQKKRIGNDLDKMNPGDFAFGAKYAANYRNGIILQERFANHDTAVIFGFDLNGDDPINSEDDGRSVACNFLTPYDLQAYADWAGLRPHSEMEYEKACRPRNPAVVGVPRSFAWEWPEFTPLLDWNTGTVDNTNAEEEHVILPLKAVKHGRMNGPKRHQIGPVKCGGFASGSSDIYESGASRWGIMELTGNLAEIYYNARQGNEFNGEFFGDGNIWSSVASWRKDSVVHIWNDREYRCGSGDVITYKTLSLPTINKKNHPMTMILRYAYPYNFGSSYYCGWVPAHEADVTVAWPVLEWPGNKNNFMLRGGSFATEAGSTSMGDVVADKMAVSYRGDTIYAKASEEDMRYNHASFRVGRSVPMKSILTGVIAAENMRNRDTSAVCATHHYTIRETEAGDDTPATTIYVWEMNNAGKGWSALPNSNVQNLVLSNCLVDTALMHVYTFRRQSIASHAQSYGNEVTLVVPGYQINGGQDRIEINRYVSYVELTARLGVAGSVKVEWRVDNNDTWKPLSDNHSVTTDKILIDRSNLAPSIPIGNGGYGTVRVTVVMDGCEFSKEIGLSVLVGVAACPATATDTEGNVYAVGQLADSRCWTLSDAKIDGGRYTWEQIEAKGNALCPDGFAIANGEDWKRLAYMNAQIPNLDCDHKDWMDTDDPCNSMGAWVLYNPGFGAFVSGLKGTTATGWWMSSPYRNYLSVNNDPDPISAFAAPADDYSPGSKHPVRCVRSATK